MSRCVRCHACQYMYDMTNCKHCDYPNEDTRTDVQVLEDDAYGIELYGDEE